MRPACDHKWLLVGRLGFPFQTNWQEQAAPVPVPVPEASPEAAPVQRSSGDSSHNIDKQASVAVAAVITAYIAHKRRHKSDTDKHPKQICDKNGRRDTK